MFSESRDDRRRRIGDSAAADRLRDRDNAAGIGDNSAEISDNAVGIVDIAANVIPSQTLSWMECGVTLFLEDKFQRGKRWLDPGSGNYLDVIPATNGDKKAAIGNSYHTLQTG